MTHKSFLVALTSLLLMGVMLTTLVGCAQPVQAPPPAQPTQPVQPTQPPAPKTLTVFAAASLARDQRMNPSRDTTRTARRVV